MANYFLDTPLYKHYLHHPLCILNNVLLQIQLNIQLFFLPFLMDAVFYISHQNI